MPGHVPAPRCVADHVQRIQIDLQRARDRQQEAERSVRPCGRPRERSDRRDDEEQREVPFGNQEDVRGDDPRVVPELARKKRFDYGAEEDVKSR